MCHEYAFEEFKSKLEGWVEEAWGGDITFIKDSDNTICSSINPTDKWWSALSSKCDLLLLAPLAVFNQSQLVTILLATLPSKSIISVALPITTTIPRRCV